ncbi:protein MLP1 homolog [Actinia tenebrosa]|uniref:Protein MLP1 homolog n=1 Tax=Actinia tenebrosa TaxID=6105 RepID=A0A6P8IFG3_ACTTE|nr:protein MLP1 homolog [Actinia tenebrosa]
MASALNAKKVDSNPLGAPYSRPSKIPVRTGHSSGSASDDSDTSSKSESRSKTGGKSHLPVPVKSPAKKAVHSSKAGTSGSESDPEKNSTKGVEEKVVPATEKSNFKSEDTGAEPVKKMPARLKSLKLKKTPSVNRARCVNPLSRSVIPDIKEKKVPAKASSGALAFVQQGRLRPARKFQAKKADDLPEEEQGRPSGGIGRKTSYRNIHSPELLNHKKCDEPGKKVNNVGLKNSKKTSPSSKSNEKPNSSRTGSKSKTSSKAATTKKRSKSDRKSKESDDSESDNSLGLKPRKLDFFYEAESDDLVSTDSESPCAPKEVQSKKEDLFAKEENNEDCFVSDNLWLLNRKFDYEDGSDFFTTDSESECAPKEDQSVQRGVPSQSEEVASNCEDSQQRSTEHPKDLERQDRVVPSTSTIENEKMPRGFDDELKIKIDFAYEESSYSEDSEEDSDKKENHLEDGGKETTALFNCQMVSNEDTNENSDKKKDQLHDGGKDTTALSNCQMVSSVTSSSIDDDDTSDNSISALSDDSFWDIDVKKPSKPEKAIEKSAEFILAASELEGLKKDIKPENLQVVDDCQYTGNNSSRDSGNEAVVDAMKDVVREKNVQPSTSVIVENQDDQVVKIGSSPSDKDNEPVDKKEMKRDIDGKKNKSESADEDSFIEELDELLSAAEAEIEEASQKDEASDASDDYFSRGKEASTLDNKVTDTPTLQQTEADDMISKPVQDVCVDGMVTASNETRTTAGNPSGSEKDEKSGNVGDKKQDVAGGSSSGEGSSVGGSGDGDDPNDPWKPKPRKEPEDKKGDDNDNKEKKRAAKKALDKQMVGITEDLLQEECVGTSTDKSGKQQTALNPEHNLGEGSSSMQIKAALQEVKASQTEEEGNVEALQKTIRSKDKEIALMQNLVDCCRKDYEELQESFNQYSKDFKEVDENRAKIGALRNENNTLKQENSKLKNQMSQKTSEATQAQEKSKKLKNMLSKMEVDLGFLETEKKELLTKLRKHEAKTPPEEVQVQKTEDKKEHEIDKNRLEHGLGRSCSLQDVEAMKAEEENVELKNKIHQCEASLKTQKKECADLKEKIAKMTKTENQLKSRFQRMKEENDVLNSKCSQLVRQWKEASIGDRIEDLKKLQGEISEASKALLTDGTGNELKVTSSPLSVELAEADTFSQTQQPGASQNDQSSELQTLIESLRGMTEELREKINKTNAKLTKADSENGNSEVMKKNEELVKQLNEEIASLHETMEVEAAKFQQLEWIIKSSNTERQRLEERIEELEEELCQADNNLSETTAAKDHQLNNAKHDIEMKQLKVDELLGELRMLLEGNDALRTALNAQNSKLDKRESEEKDLKKYIDELELENETLSVKSLKTELSERKENNERLDKKLKDIVVEKQDLEQKLEAVKDNESSRRQTEIHLNHIQKLQGDCENQRLCVKSLKGEVSELKEKNASLDKKLKDVVVEKQTLEQKLKAVDKKLKDVVAKKQDLEQKLEVNKENESSRRQTEIHLNHIQKLQGDCENQRLSVKSLKDELSELKDKNATLDKKLKNVAMEKEVLEQKLEAVKDAETFRRQTEIHLNHIQKLQGDCENQRFCVKSLKGELSELKNKNASLDKKLKEVAAEKQALEQKLKAFSQEIQKEESVSSTPSTSAESEARIMELQTFNEKLSEKIDMFEAFFEQVKEDKVQNMKAMEASRQNAIMLKSKSDEQIAELEKTLADKNVLETKLQDTVTSLEKRISTLEAEKLESESQVKAMVESMQGQNELEKCKKEWEETEVELQNSILALTTEKSEAQKELEEHKSAVAKTSESLEFRMKELEKCLQDRQTLQEELACLKSTHSKQKEEMEKTMEKMGQDVDEREAEVKLVRQSSSEIINELEKQLKGRQDSEIELQERAETLSQQIDQLKAEKLESDKKIQALMESIEAKEVEIKLKKLDEDTELKENLSNMEVKISELATEKENAEKTAQHDIMLIRRESEEKITALEKRLQDQSDSETMLQEKVQSLESRISQLNAEKAERDDNMKTLMEAMDANKNLEEKLKKKEELGRELASKVEEMRLKFSTIRSTKKHLEHQLAKKDSEFLSSSRNLKLQSKQLQDDLDGCAEREKELNERIKRLTEDNRKAEERESEALLAKKSSDDKIRVLEKQMLSKGQSEQDLKERMTMLEDKISRLEAEKSQHCKNISSMLRKLKTKEDLADAITAKDKAEREYKIKIDEMEVIVNKLRKEKNKADCDEELKERYKEEYEESRRNIRRLTENVNRCNERVKELQSFVNETVEDDEPQHLQKPTLQENIENLKRSLKASDIELFKTLQSLNQKITHLEDEKAEGEKMITSILKSMEDKEKIEHCIAISRDADKKMMLRMNEMADAIQRLRIEKKRVEHELQNSEKQRAAKECESELLQSQTDEKISSLQQSLKERYESEWEIQKRLEAVSEKLAQMESAKEQADKTIQTMLESLQWKDNLEQCLEEKDKIEKELKRRVQELKLENKEALLEAKLYRGQCRDAHKMKEQISSLKEQLLQMEAEKDKDIESLKELLQQKEEKLELLQKTLKEEVFKLKLQKKDLEIETKKSQIQARDAFELIQKRSHEFDECLNVRNESSDRMMAEMENLKESLKMTLAERDELENKAKKYAKFSEVGFDIEL